MGRGGPASLHAQSAVDHDTRAGDVAGAVVEQGSYRERGVVRVGQPVHWDLPGDGGDEGGVGLGGDAGVGSWTGDHEVDGGAGAGQFAGQRLGESEQAGLARRVRTLVGVAHRRRDRADDHDAAVPAGGDVGDRGPRQAERPGEVGGEHRVPVVVGERGQRSVAGDAGRGHDVVEPAEALDGRVDGPPAVDARAGVGAQHAEARVTPGQRLGGGGVGQVRDEYRPAVGEQVIGDRPAEPAGAATDNCDAARAHRSTPISARASCLAWSMS